jgi:nitroreductase/FMN reductase [NAD(P)H]
MATLSDLITARFGLDADVTETRPAEETLAHILNHRSIRTYADREVSGDLVKTLLACAQSAPAKSDLQQYAIIHLTNPAQKETLAELAGTATIATAPIVLVFCGDIRRIQRVARFRDKPYVQNTVDSFMNAAVDAAIAMQNFTLAAQAAGLGCCYISQVRNHMAEVCTLLRLPPGVFPVCGLTAGWPAEAPDVTLRLPPQTVVHQDFYDDENLESDIDAYDRRRHAKRPLATDKQLHQDRFGEAAFYGWSEAAARRMSAPATEIPLRDFLLSHGFDLS